MFIFFEGASLKIAKNLIKITGMKESLAIFKENNMANIGQDELLKQILGLNTCNLMQTMKVYFADQSLDEEDRLDIIDDYVVENLRLQDWITFRDGADRMESCQEILGIAEMLQLYWKDEKEREAQGPGPRYHCVKDVLRHLGNEKNKELHDALFEFVYLQHKQFIYYFRSLMDPVEGGLAGGEAETESPNVSVSPVEAVPVSEEPPTVNPRPTVHLFPTTELPSLDDLGAPAEPAPKKISPFIAPIQLEQIRSVMEPPPLHEPVKKMEQAAPLEPEPVFERNMLLYPEPPVEEALPAPEPLSLKEAPLAVEIPEPETPQEPLPIKDSLPPLEPANVFENEKISGLTEMDKPPLSLEKVEGGEGVFEPEALAVSKTEKPPELVSSISVEVKPISEPASKIEPVRVEKAPEPILPPAEPVSISKLASGEEAPKEPQGIAKTMDPKKLSRLIELLLYIEPTAEVDSLPPAGPIDLSSPPDSQN